VTLPICSYPEKATYNGRGSATDCVSYACGQTSAPALCPLVELVGAAGIEPATARV
jgi:hypothetical protein